MEEELVEQQEKKELSEMFPNYGEFIVIHEGEKMIGCKMLGHKERVVHHQFFTKVTERGKEWYECHVCPRCKNIEGKLVRISKEG